MQFTAVTTVSLKLSLSETAIIVTVKLDAELLTIRYDCSYILQKMQQIFAFAVMLQY